MKAYHSDPKHKSEILKQLRAHARADELVQGYGYWKDGKGCAVGCTLHSGDHAEYEPKFGIPQALARLEDAISEGLTVEKARKWPVRFMSAIEPGSDLTRVHWKFLHWILTDKTANPGIDHPLVMDAVKKCADLIYDLSIGKKVTAESTWSAESAAESARAAESAAESAEWSARSAAWSAEWSAWERMSDKLIELIKEAGRHPARCD